MLISDFKAIPDKPREQSASQRTILQRHAQMACLWLGVPGKLGLVLCPESEDLRSAVPCNSYPPAAGLTVRRDCTSL